MRCPNCSNENKNTNIRCEFCSTQLIDISEYNQQNPFKSRDIGDKYKEVSVSAKKIGCLANILFFVFFGQLLLIGLMLLVVGLFSNVLLYKETKGYEKTNAVFKDYTNCNYDEGSELCKVTYGYQVNGTFYTSTIDSLKNPEVFDKIDTVYYNPENPQESKMLEIKDSFTLLGLIIVSVVIVLFIIKNIVVKKILKDKDTITMKVYKRN